MTCGVILRHATQGAEGGVRARLSLYNNVLIYNQVTGIFFSAMEKRNACQNTKAKSIRINTKCAGNDLLKVQITPTLAPSFRIIKVNVIRESREHSFSQDNMENFTAFIPS